MPTIDTKLYTHVDALTSAFTTYTYLFYFAQWYIGSTLWPTLAEEERDNRFIYARASEAFLVRSSDNNQYSGQLKFPFVSLHPSSPTTNEDTKFLWNNYRNMARVLEKTDDYEVSARNDVINFEATLFAQQSQDELFKFASLCETLNRFNKTFSWSITESVQAEWSPDPIKVSVGVPVFARFSSLELNPVYDEAEWLEKNKIYTMNCNLTLQTLKPLVLLKRGYKVQSIEVDIDVINERTKVVVDTEKVVLS